MKSLVYYHVITYFYLTGVGNSTNKDELFHIASVPEDKFMYEFDTFESLDATNVSLAVNYVKCKGNIVNIAVRKKIDFIIKLYINTYL